MASYYADSHEGLRTMREDTDAKRQRVVQLESEALELAKELEIAERVSLDRRDEAARLVDELQRRELTIDSRHAQHIRRLGDERDRLESAQSALEDMWRALEDDITTNDAQLDAERQRLRNTLRELDDREHALRDAQREMSGREREAELRRRRLAQRAENLRSLDAAHIAALQEQLRRRLELVDVS
jgi:chromosome segregation ATPase